MSVCQENFDKDNMYMTQHLIDIYDSEISNSELQDTISVTNLENAYKLMSRLAISDCLYYQVDYHQDYILRRLMAVSREGTIYTLSDNPIEFGRIASYESACYFSVDGRDKGYKAVIQGDV